MANLRSDPPAKWSRAIQLLSELDAQNRSYIERAFTRSPELAQKGVLRVGIAEDPPAELSLVVGDVLQNLHSALDHEIYALSARTKGHDWPGLDRCAFPTFTDPGKYAEQRRTLIGGLPEAAQEVVDRFQLCDSAPKPQASSLHLLNDLARIDRHRLLHLIGVGIRGIEIHPREPGVSQGESPLPPPTESSMADVKITFDLRFADGPARDRNVIHVLNEFVVAVADVIDAIRAAADG